MHEQATNGKKRIRVAQGLYQRGNSFIAGYTGSDGRWHMTVLKGAQNLTQAKRMQREVATKNDRGELAAPCNVAVQDVFKAWLDALDKKPRTKKAYASSWKTHLEPRIGTRRVQSITVRDCLAFISSMKTSSSASTTNVAMAVLSSILGHAITEGLITTNPMRSVPRGSRPRSQRKAIRILSDQELATLLEALPDPYRDVAYLVSRTGLRQAEALGLHWGDMSLPDRSILVCAQKAVNRTERVPVKNSTPRGVPLDPETVEFLLHLREQRFALGLAKSEDWVFCHPDGSCLKEGGYGRALRLAAEVLRLDGFSGHALRHRYGSLLFERGVPAKTCARILGHSLQEFLKTYAHEVDPGQQDELVRAALSSGRRL